uniref:Uncharacterized protein n=1 Tax=Pipistrellus kuhlii TaxID=59472 RepID=A0A7J8A905_PIPKU|nr:hypothetical protein mPipKuh1_008998 [Pipistrellus kuhlii]
MAGSPGLGSYASRGHLEVLGYRTKELLPKSLPNFIQKQVASSGLKGWAWGSLKIELGQCITSSAKMTLPREWRKVMCIEVLKATADEAHSPSKPRAKQETRQGGWCKDSRHRNIARLRSKGGKDARRLRVAETGLAQWIERRPAD